jgi:hypothetical protein
VYHKKSPDRVNSSTTKPCGIGFTLFVHLVDVVGTDLDQVVNKLLVSEAKAMGASRVDLKSASTTPRHGIFTLPAFLIGFPTSSAMGVAVK